MGEEHLHTLVVASFCLLSLGLEPMCMIISCGFIIVILRPSCCPLMPSSGTAQFWDHLWAIVLTVPLPAVNICLPVLFTPKSSFFYTCMYLTVIDLNQLFLLTLHSLCRTSMMDSTLRLTSSTMLAWPLRVWPLTPTCHPRDHHSNVQSEFRNYNFCLKSVSNCCILLETMMFVCLTSFSKGDVGSITS